jgi:hypothetical protein
MRTELARRRRESKEKQLIPARCASASVFCPTGKRILMRRRAYVRHTLAVVLVLLGVAALVVVGERFAASTLHR